MNGGSRPRAAGTGLARAGFVAIAVIAIAAYWRIHWLAGFSFPVPVPDEGAFLWQALAIAEHGSLLAPQLHPDRHILWMPPGYPALTGAIFWLTGFSFEWARALSAGFLTAGFVALALALRRLRAPFASLLLLCGVFLARDFVFAGNLARMESLLVAVLALAGLLLVRGRRIEAVALLAFAPLVHPNALPTAAAALAWAGLGWLRRREDWRPARVGGLLLALSACAWFAYATYVGLHWHDFVHDMGFQLRWKEQPGPLELAFWSSWAAPWRLGLAVLLGVALVGGLAFESPAVRLLWIAGPLGLLPLASGEWYYGVLRALIFVLLGICVIDVVARAAEARGLGRWSRAAVAALALAAMAAIGRGADWIESPFGYPHAMRVAGMAITPAPVYIDEVDRLAVRARLADFVAHWAGDEPPRVAFTPRADALFFHELERTGLRFAHPTLTTLQPDLAIVHLTRLIPESNRFYSRQRLLEVTRGLPLLRARDGSEEWRVNPMPGPASHGVRELRRRDRD